MNPDIDSETTREIFLAFWKVHILLHAAEGPVVGQWMIEELRRHGYDVSPGTMYPLLHRMEKHGWLRCDARERAHARAAKHYHLTKKGHHVLGQVQEQLTQLQRELKEVRKAVRSRARRNAP